MSARRRSLVVVPIVLVGAALGGELRASSDEELHRLRFYIHVDLLEPDQGRDLDFWKEQLRHSLERAKRALRGKQGAADIPCCTGIEPEVDLQPFGRPGDGDAVVTSSREYQDIRASFRRSGVVIVFSLEACGSSLNPGIVGCADLDGDFMIVDVVDDDNGLEAPSFAVNLEFLGLTIAHERGHNAGLEHVSIGTCAMMAPTIGGGCLSLEECRIYREGATDPGGVCACMGELPGDAPLADGIQCGGSQSCGLCSGSICGACEGDAGVSLFAVADTGMQAGGTPDDLLDMSALTGSWRRVDESTPGELSGLAYDPSRDRIFGVGPGDSGADRLVRLGPARGELRSELPLDCSGTTLDCEPVVSLAYDADADLLYGVQLGNQYLGQTKSCSDCVNNLIAIDPQTGVVTRLGEPDYLDREITGLAYDSEAQILYAASEEDVLAIDLAGCGPLDPCPFTFVAATGKPAAGLSIDPRNGRLHLVVNRVGDLTYRVIDPSAPRSDLTDRVAPDFTVRLDSVGVAGLAARPVPEPAARPLQHAALGLLALVASARRPRSRRRSSGRRAWRSLALGLLACACVVAGGSPPAGADPPDAVGEAEDMVRARYYEGLPEERARSCSEACVTRLSEMLDDASEEHHHANILRVLGFSPHAGAFEALEAFAAREPRGDVSGSAYNARVEVMLALGNKARRDPRALQLLLERADRAPRAPVWSAGPLRGEALRGAIQRGVLRGLALSGRPEAGARLRAMEAEARLGSGGPIRLRGVRAALELHGRVERGEILRGLDGREGQR